MHYWPQRVVDAGVRTADGRSYRPQARNVSPLRYLDDPKALLAEMQRVLDSDDFTTGSSGWDTVIAQVGPEYVWEWLIMDPRAPWAKHFTNEDRGKVAQGVALTLERLG
jgi:hypothetical protein